ncbi:hypothetical protein PCYB_003770 [Plasmodium cynomolgi strain B]|uniref:Methyltransferase n=1 Tax=Plasmodium cynomolgi (strain B) TaxID=1120755 RepID=K6UNM4_PLACD|nr:hypothetical protein PCYB_003770 [Plasmodium cynomolgi strain B]GAB69628.1 hypothetical protein PCYB_003770 [Plasmodium cynomolgi strain B]
MSNVLDERDGSAVSGMNGVTNRGGSTPNSHNDTAFRTNLEDGKIIQECTHQVLMNEKARVKNGESEEEDIIRIREIGLNNKVVLELGAGIGLASILLFTHVNIVHNGTNQGANQVVITDVNLYTLSNISHNVLLNEELFGHLDSAWSKVKI